MLKFIIVLFIPVIQVLSNTITADTTSGRLLGTQVDGVASFKGIRFAHSPVGELRWEPPVPFVSSETQNATSLGPSCVQQFLFVAQAITQPIYNTPAPPESEDCLFLNVWTPAPISGTLKPVIVWIYGGAFVFGTASLPMYDGMSFAKNQDVVFVSFNYRTNVFGFPTASDLPPSGNNPGFLDQELALAWVQDNIARFGGDKNKVTLMGQSAGGGSISHALTRRNSAAVPPFHAGIILSGFFNTISTLNFSNFDALATAVGCAQSPGPQRLQCLRNVPTSAIRQFTNGPNSGSFSPGVDNITTVNRPLQRIRAGKVPKVPILLGSMEDDGSVLVFGAQNISTFIGRQFGPLSALFPPDLVRALYPGLSDPQVIAAAERDIVLHCPAKLWSEAFVKSGVKDVYRYTYGAVFSDLQPFPNLGAWHGSELPILFGTFNRSTATAAEVELSQTLQTAFANFAKNPTNGPPAPNWPPYESGTLGVAPNATLAKIAYEGNVSPNDFVKPVQPFTMDEQCIVWDDFLNYSL